MKIKTLSSANNYLQSSASSHLVARNLASSTSVETGKSSQFYVARYQDSHSGKIKPKNTAKSHQKSAS